MISNILLVVLLVAVGVVAGLLFKWHASGRNEGDSVSPELVNAKEDVARSSAIIEAKNEKIAALEQDVSELQSRLDCEKQAWEAARQELNREILEANGIAKVKGSQLDQVQQQLDDAKSAMAEEKTSMEKERQDLTRRLLESDGLVKTRSAQIDALREQLEEVKISRKTEMEELAKRLNERFQTIAAQILDEKTEKLNSEGGRSLKAVLEPFGVSLKEFKDAVTGFNTQAVQARSEVNQHLKDLMSTSAKLGDNANNLANALMTNSQRQGQWGEVTLERLLESSGLVKGVEYDTQVQLKDDANENMLTDEDRKMRPDVVVYLPEERRIIIDAKCSITAFARAVESQTDEAARDAAMAEHLASTRKHVNELIAKKYHLLPGSLDYVLMFIPSEAAYATTMQLDRELWEYASKRNVLLTCPMTLLAMLKVAVFMWRQEKQIKNVRDIMDRAYQMHKKAVGFVETIEKLRDSMKKVDDAVEKAYLQLCSGRGSLVSQIKKLEDLGVKHDSTVSKNLAEMAQVEDEKALAEE